MSDVPAEKVRVHICWGNYEGPHVCDIPMSKTFDTLMLTKSHYVLFETSNPRHGHEWAVFCDRAKDIPEDKVLVPGVVDTTTNFVEHPDLVAERIGRFGGRGGTGRLKRGWTWGISVPSSVANTKDVLMRNPVTPAFEQTLQALLPAAAFKEDTAPYLSEPRGRWMGQGLVVAPASTEEVSSVVRACAKARVGIVPYSGGTGLVGGQLMQEGPAPVVLSLERMNKIRAVYPSENVLVCDAGVILANVQRAAEDVGRLFPLSLASEGSARIGGLLSTNAGGVNVLRYGNARAQCLGLEVVRPDGSIWHGLTRLRKDNTGYDLRNLMIGAEGTLGIITAAALKLAPQPVGTGAAMMAVASPAAALELLAMAGEQIGEGVSAFEIMHRQGFDFLDEVGPDFQSPFTDTPEWTVLIDVGLPAGLSPEAALEGLFEAAYQAGLVSDGAIAQSHAQRDAFWHIRESIPEANRRIGSVSSHDISIPLSEISAFIAQGSQTLAGVGAFRINCFGHLGDGNLHYNVFPTKGKNRADYEAERSEVKRVVHDLVHSLGGSVSAEHGIGRLKVADLEKYGDPVKIAMLRSIKDALDPLGIMNPGAVLRETI